jgi:hypothetical protein
MEKNASHEVNTLLTVGVTITLQSSGVGIVLERLFEIAGKAMLILKVYIERFL